MTTGGVPYPPKDCIITFREPFSWGRFHSGSVSDKEPVNEKKPGPKRRVRTKKFISCGNCKNWVTTRIESEVCYGHCGNVKKCPSLS